MFSEVWDGVERGANTEIRRVKVQNDIRTSIYKQTNIPDFQLRYPCKCLARYARSPISGEKSDNSS